MITILTLVGYLILFFGERAFGDGGLRFIIDGVGLTIIIGSLAALYRSQIPGHDRAKQAKATALKYGAASLLVLPLYAYTLRADGVLAEVTTFAWPILWLTTIIPYILVNATRARHPMMVPRGARSWATRTGVGVALSFSMLFPVNYLANHHSMEWDTAYFRATRPGDASIGMVKGLATPLQVTLFYTPGNKVKEELIGYFRTLESATDGGLTLTVVDQPAAPKTAEAYEVKQNGTIVFAQGDEHRKFRVQEDFDRAKRDLQRLDRTVQKNLLKLTEEPKTAYIMVGHGEVSLRNNETKLYKLAKLKTELQNQNFKIKEFGLAQGSSDAIPEDCAFLILAAPTTPLIESEVRAIHTYLDNGGALLALVETGRASINDVIHHVGLSAGTTVLANATTYLKQSQSTNDRLLLFSNRFGSHAAVSSLAKGSNKVAVLVPTVVNIEPVEGYEGKTNELIRALPNTFADVNHNRQLDPGEQREKLNFAMSSGGEEGQHRVIVIGDASVFSDAMFSLSPGNKTFALDAARWLSGTEEQIGEVNSEEDVKITHSKDSNTAWFYGTILLFPAFILVMGAIIIRRHRRQA